MNDRYLYRAKRTDNGEWINGSLIQTPYLGSVRSWISSEQDDKTRLRSISTYQAEWRAFEVRTDTICQCTGLKDKNSKLIWENDIVKQFADCDELGNSLYFFYQIRWNNEYSAFEGYEIYTKEMVLFPDLEDIEVIGSAIDNPELLEVGE